MSRDRFYVTTPIYYVNDLPHIGHAYTTILADVLARYHRLLGTPTWFLTGTDEHGQKVQRAAEKAGITPRRQADNTVVRFQSLWKKLGITHDDFIRTTEDRHGRVVQAILQDLYDRGEIYKADYDGWYCVPCERFFTDHDVAEPKCAECGRPLERLTETNYFFRMGKYQEWLLGYIQEHPKFIQPDFRRNETLGFLQKKLNDLCISRPKTRLSWGIELPFDNRFVTYVWFDALVNYISAVGYRADEEQFKRWWPASLQLIGKDILTTHTVYWPTMLKAMDVPMPETIFAHGWWLIEGSKMSKSDGNVVNPMDLAEKYGVDAFRYFLLAEMVLGQDAGFSEEAFVRRYNTDLANDLGNFVNRIMKLIATHCGRKVQAPGEMTEPDNVLREAALNAVRTMEESIAKMRLDLGLGAVSAVLREANRYLEKRQPWTLAKAADPKPLHTVLYTSVETLRIISGLLYPTMPEKMTALRKTLGFPDQAPTMSELGRWGGTEPGIEIGEMTSLFPRILTPKAEAGAVPAAEKAPAQGAPAPVPAGVVEVEYADFAKLQLRTATIVQAEKVEGADKLLRLQIKVGEEARQIVAGIALYYKPEELPGKTIVIVANLKPAVIRGVESKGMLLAASQGGQLRLITVDGDLSPGAVVK